MSLPWEEMKPEPPVYPDADVVAICSELAPNRSADGIIWSIVPICGKLAQSQWDALRRFLPESRVQKAQEMRVYGQSLGFR